MTSGDVILLADQDDRWKPQKVERLLTLLQEERADLVFTDADLIDAEGRSLGRRLWPAVGFGPKELVDWRDGSPLDVLLKRPVVTGATVAIRRYIEEGSKISRDLTARYAN